MAKEKSSEQVMNVGEIEFRVPKLYQCDELPEGNKLPQCFPCSLSSCSLKIGICRKIYN